MATTVSYSIVDTVDDGSWLAYSGAWTDTVAYVGNFAPIAGSDSPIYAGFRFRGVQVPVGATVTSAVLSLAINGAASGSEFGVIRGAAVDNAPLWATTGPNSITKTAASTTVTVAALPSLNVTAQVQEIVSRPGWAIGNALSLATDGSGVTGLLQVFDFATSAPSAAKLTITYEEGGGGTTESRTLSTGGSSAVTMRGGSRRAAKLVAAGVAAVAFSGAALSTKPATLTSSGTSAASFPGSSVSSSRAQSQGSSSAAFSARLIASSELVTGGSSSAAFSSQSVKSSVLSSVGASSAAISGGSTWNGKFTASSGSVAEFSGQRLETRAGTLTAAGESWAGFSGASVSRSALTANGTSNATFYALGQGSFYNIASDSSAAFSGASSAAGTLSSAGGSSTDLDATAVRDAEFYAAGGSQFLAHATATASSEFSVSGVSVADFYATSGSPSTFIIAGTSKFTARSAAVNPPPTPSGREIIVARVDRFVVADNYDRTVTSIQRSRTVS